MANELDQARGRIADIAITCDHAIDQQLDRTQIFEKGFSIGWKTCSVKVFFAYGNGKASRALLDKSSKWWYVPSKANYDYETDSIEVPWGKGEKNFEKRVKSAWNR